MANTRWVVISYSPKRSEVGKVVELPADEAKLKVAEGRARYATDEQVAEATGAGGDEAATSTEGGSATESAAEGGARRGRGK